MNLSSWDKQVQTSLSEDIKLIGERKGEREREYNNFFFCSSFNDYNFVGTLAHKIMITSYRLARVKKKKKTLF